MSKYFTIPIIYKVLCLYTQEAEQTKYGGKVAQAATSCLLSPWELTGASKWQCLWQESMAHRKRWVTPVHACAHTRTQHGNQV